MEHPFVQEYENQSQDDAATSPVMLDQVYLNAEGNSAFWGDVFANMASLLMQVTAEVAPGMGPLEIKKALQEEYRFQPLLGLSSALDRPHMVPFIEPTVKINGVDCPGVPAVVNAFDEILKRERLLEVVPYTRILGNLSLENMQYDIEEKQLNVAGRKRSRPFGDLRHDLARFAFSLLGGRTHLKLKTNGMQGLKLEWLSGYPYDEAQEMFRNWQEVLNPALIRQIPLIMSLDCFAMLKEENLSPLEQQAMLARGLLGLRPFIMEVNSSSQQHVA